jgi:hypothetical protein
MRRVSNNSSVRAIQPKLSGQIMGRCARFSDRSICFVYSLATALAILMPGCSGESIERATVSGSVTLDGKPLSSGQIRFRPTGENRGPGWSAWIKDGHYTTEGTKGTPVGELRVEIDGYRTPSWYKPTTAPPDDDVQGMIPQEQFLAPKYNLQSELTMSIPSGSGSVEKNWDLTSQ